MRRSLAIIVLLLVVALGVALWRWRSAVEDRARRQWKDAIRSVLDTTREPGWLETFEATGTMPLTEYDRRWRPLFGSLLVHGGLAAAIGDPQGGWQHDGGDDYAFRAADVPSGSVEMTVDGYWDGHGSVAGQVAVQLAPPHRLYEATLWRGGVALIYFVGPTPDKYVVLAESTDPMRLSRGFYRLQFCAERRDTSWHLRAIVRSPGTGYRILRQVSAIDSRLGDGVQGIGLLGGGGSNASYVTGVAVRSLQGRQGCGTGATP
jgi:hypothetical protein